MLFQQISILTSLSGHRGGFKQFYCLGSTLRDSSLICLERSLDINMFHRLNVPFALRAPG